jgi:glycosyltransferase involved in cell wall biosynthesis/GT2 family glycosyltransferase
MNGSRLIVVLGMHRSGTSVITRALKIFGVTLGEHLLGAKEDNPKGFWEDIDINGFNIELLDAIGSNSADITPIEHSHIDFLRKKGFFDRAVRLILLKLKHTPIFGLKDPRIAKLLPFWKEVFNYCKLDISYVLAIRHPMSVAESMAKRDKFDNERTYLLWLAHVIGSLTICDEYKCVIVDYDRMMQSPDRELNRIAKNLDLYIDPTELQSYKAEFLDNDLRHTIFTMDDLVLDPVCPPLVRDIYSFLLEVASDQISLDNLELQQRIISWNEEYTRYKSTLMLVDKLFVKISSLTQEVIAISNDVAHMHQIIADRDVQINELTQEVIARSNDVAHMHQVVADRDVQIAMILKSISWQITRPIRAIKKRLNVMNLSNLKCSIIYRLFCVTPGLIRKFINELKNSGLKSALRKVKQKILFVVGRHVKNKHECTFQKSGKAYEIKVSVIIPTYNRSALLPSLLECWKQVNKVTKYKYEIIFSDDGSEDGSLNILERDKTLPIKIIKNNHGGAAKARNSAIKAAQGEKLLIIGDDIFPNPEIINQHYEKLQELPVCKAVLGEVIWHKDLEVNTLMKHITELGNEQFSFEHFLHNTFTDFRHFYTCNISIDREFLVSEKIIFDESFYKVNFEDIELGYRLSKKGMEVFYYPDAIVEHYHSYKSVSSFCKRQQTAGEMALVFKRLHPEVEWVVQVDQILSQWNLAIKDVKNLELEPSLVKVIELCQIIEDKKYIEKFKFEKLLSNIYKVLFRFHYEKGVIENSYTLENNVVDKVFTKHFLPLISKYIKEINAQISLDVIESILDADSTQSRVQLVVEVNGLEQLKEIQDSYKEFEKDVFFRLKSDSKDCNTLAYIYKPENTFHLHPSNLKQIILFLQNNSSVDFVLLSFGLIDYPSIGLSESLSNNVILKNNGVTLADISSSRYSGKLIRLMSERYEKKVKVDEIVKKLKFNNYGYSNDNQKVKIENQISHFNTTLYKKSSKKVVFVFPIFLAVGGVERNTVEIINQLNAEYDFVVINFERLNESLGSLHHQFLDSCIGIYDLTELSSHDGILNYLRVLENLYSPDLVWICNGSPWLESNLANIRSIFNNSAIVDQQVYDANEGWVRLYKEKNGALLSFDRFIAINSKIRNVFIDQANVLSDKVDLIYHVVKTERFDKRLYIDSQKIVNKFNINLSKDNFIFVGRMSEQKRPFLFLEMVSEIIKRNTDIHFYMVGTGHLADKVDDYISNNNLDKFVTRIKHLDNIAEIYSLMNGLIITSQYEGLPIAMLEAMCMEVPIYATSVGDIDVVIDEYKNGLVVNVNYDAKALANNFVLFCSELDSYKKNAIAASALVRSRFSEKTISNLYDISFKCAIEDKI